MVVRIREGEECEGSWEVVYLIVEVVSKGEGGKGGREVN